MIVTFFFKLIKFPIGLLFINDASLIDRKFLFISTYRYIFFINICRLWFDFLIMEVSHYLLQLVQVFQLNLILPCTILFQISNDRNRVHVESTAWKFWCCQSWKETQTRNSGNLGNSSGQVRWAQYNFTPLPHNVLKRQFLAIGDISKMNVLGEHIFQQELH